MYLERSCCLTATVVMGSTQDNGQPPPCLLDGKPKRLHDRLKNINVAMTWIKGELVSVGCFTRGSNLSRKSYGTGFSVNIQNCT